MSRSFWKVHQRTQVTHKQEETAKARQSLRTAERAARTMTELEEEVDKLTLVCHALWSFISESTGATEDQLLERIREADLLDGVEDGKVEHKVTNCVECGRTLAIRHIRCLYCGTESRPKGPFEF